MRKIDFLKGASSRIVSITNILTNSNFASTSGWTSTGTSFSVSGNVASFTANSANDVLFRSDVTIINAHKYYVSGWIKASSASVKMNFWEGPDGSGVELNLPCAGSGSFEFLSGIVTVGTSISNARMHAVFDTRTSGWNAVNAKYISIVDLTAAFGAGNEPTKTMMDLCMQQLSNYWVNGTQSVVC